MKHLFPLRLMPHAFRLMLAGHILILLSLCDFAARLSAGGSVEVLLYIREYIHSAAAAWVMLWGAGLGLDLWERSV
jgi:hypothetical protein